MSKKNYDIKTLFSDLKKDYQKLSLIDEKSIDNAQREIELENRKERTKKYLVVVVASSLSIILYPFIFVKLFRILDKTAELVKYIVDLVPEDNIGVFNFSFILGSFSILCYLFLFPSFRLFGKQYPAKSETYDIDRRQSNYIFMAISGAYIALGLVCFLFMLNSDKIGLFLIDNFKYYLFVPLSILTFFLTLFSSALILIYPFRKTISKNFSYSSNKRLEISLHLLHILERLVKNNNGEYVSNETISVVIRRILIIKGLISNYQNNIIGNNSNSEIEENFKKASNEFGKLEMFLIENQENLIEEFKDKIVDYFNIFYQGKLKELPKSDIIEEQKEKRTTKTYHYVLLGIYLLLPIVIIVTLNIAFNISIDDYSKSLIRILYIIWAFLGIFSNPFIINAENKDLMKDLIKTLVGKN